MAMITEYIEPLLRGENLSFAQAEQLLDIVFEGDEIILKKVIAGG